MCILEKSSCWLIGGEKRRQYFDHNCFDYLLQLPPGLIYLHAIYAVSFFIAKN